MKFLVFFLSVVSTALSCTAPSGLTATAKGPTQINLTWTAASTPCYGYIVEIQSAGDSRYSSFTEVQPIPTAGGFSCNPAIIIGGNSCTFSDTSTPLAHVYNPVSNYLSTWVTESQYIDPTDGSAAQDIVGRLKNNTSYTFRVKTCTTNSATGCSSYSSTTTVSTANYTLRYVSPTGNNTTGTSPTNAWTTLATGSTNLACGQLLIVLAGNYTSSDHISKNLSCTVNNRAVIQWNIGDTIDFAMDGTIVSVSVGDVGSSGGGDYFVLDGVSGRFTGTWDTNHAKPWEIWSNHTALLGVSFGPDPSNIPSTPYGVYMHGQYALIASSYIHHIGTPDEHQVGLGGTGFPVFMASNGVYVNNHITGGAHDTGTCITNNASSIYLTCRDNQYLNNVLDGGWGTGVVTGTFAPSGGMLVEGNYIKDPGYFITFYNDNGATKACVQNGASGVTIRRNRCIVDGTTRRLIEFTSSCNPGVDPACGVHNNYMYNNDIYSPAGTARRGLYGSANHGTATYSGLTIANNAIQNIACDTIANVFMTEMYLPTGTIAHNAFLMNGGNSACSSGHIIAWNLNNQDSLCSACANPQTIGFFEANVNYLTQWVGNDALSVSAQYVDVANANPNLWDFHLQSGSPLKQAGVHIVDPNWANPSTATSPDLGSFGLISLGTALPLTTGISSRVSGSSRIVH